LLDVSAVLVSTAVQQFELNEHDTPLRNTEQQKIHEKTSPGPPAPLMVEIRVGTRNNPSSGKMVCVDYGAERKSHTEYAG
jgi:hypothetical protein